MNIRKLNEELQRILNESQVKYHLIFAVVKGYKGIRSADDLDWRVQEILYDYADGEEADLSISDVECVDEGDSISCELNISTDLMLDKKIITKIFKSNSIESFATAAMSQLSIHTI